MLGIRIKIYSSIDQEDFNELMSSLMTSESQILTSETDLDEYDNRYINVYVSDPSLVKRSMKNIIGLNVDFELIENFILDKYLKSPFYCIIHSDNVPSVAELFNIANVIDESSLSDKILSELNLLLGTSRIKMNKYVLPNDDINYTYDYLSINGEVCRKNIVTVTIDGKQRSH